MAESKEVLKESQDFLHDDLRVFVVPVEILDVPDLDVYEQMTYIVLRSYASAREATAFPSYNTIAEKGRMSRRKAIDCVDSLVKKGLLEKETRLGVTQNRKIKNTSNLYTIKRPTKVEKKLVHEMNQPGSAQYAPTKNVHSMHQVSAQHAPTLVHSMHHPSAHSAPEQKNLTIPTEQNQSTTIVVADSNVVSISDFEGHKTLLKTVIGDRVSDATINTWLRYGEPNQILKAWYKANEVSGVEDIGAYVTWMLKDGITSLDQKNTKQTQPEQNHPFYEMMRGAEEAAVAKEVSEPLEEPEVISPKPEISAQEVWANVLSELQLQLSAPAFETWVKPLSVMDCTQNQIVIKAKDEFHKDWLEQRYSVMIRSAVKTAMNTEAIVKFVV